MFAALPLLLLPVLVYNLIVLTLSGGFTAVDADVRMDQRLFSVHMTSHIDWNVTLGDLLLAAALVVLFVELLKSTTSRRIAIVNHSLSLVLFIVCLVEFLLAPACATSTFFLLGLMVLLDVLAGFIVTIVSARRDMEFTNER
ncbi:hypothetical protein [Phenylobacterium sp.]|jgi:hypothetical protein|uniref:hypothetical protein n=1 Tax=Phenylobacterium sp. TaxID=1871053 RepID=UPI002F409207